MKCPECGGKSKCMNSRNSSDPNGRRKIPGKFLALGEDFTYRDYKCYICGHNFQSIEVHGSSFEDKINAIDARLREDISILVENL